MTDNKKNIFRIVIFFVLYVVIIMTFSFLNCHFCKSFKNIVSFSDAFVYSLSNITSIGETEVKPIDNLGKVLTILSNVIGVILFALTMNSVWQYISEKDRNKLKETLEAEYESRTKKKIIQHSKIISKHIQRYQYKLFLTFFNQESQLVRIPGKPENEKRGVFDDEIRLLILSDNVSISNLANIFETFDIRFIWDTRLNLEKYLDSLDELREIIQEFIEIQVLDNYVDLEKYCFDFIQNSDIKHEIVEILWSISAKNNAKKDYCELYRKQLKLGNQPTDEYRKLYLHFLNAKRLILQITDEIEKIK